MSSAEYEYIEIVHAGTSASGKTDVFEVKAKSSGVLLGTVKWHGPWRQYVFFPQPETIYSAGCMEDLCDFIERAKAQAEFARAARHSLR